MDICIIRSRGDQDIQDQSILQVGLSIHLAVSPYTDLCSVGPYKIPTWLLPFLLTFLLSVLIPSTSFLANMMAVAVGCLCKYLESYSPLSQG